MKLKLMASNEIENEKRMKEKERNFKSRRKKIIIKTYECCQTQ